MASRRGAVGGWAGRLCGRSVIVAAGCAAAVGILARDGGPGVARGETGLQKPVQAAWTGVPLRTWAERVTELAGRPVVIDRRLDPDVAVTLDARGEPLAAVLDKVARSAGAEVVWLRSSIRIVPADAAADACGRAERAREQAVGRLPAAARQAVGRRAGWAWPEGARPRDLVSQAIDQAGLAAEGLDRVPHDHFPAATLPPLSLGERLDLVLAHFDLRIDWRAGDAGPVAAVVAIDADLPEPEPKIAPNPGKEPAPPKVGGAENPRPPMGKPPRENPGKSTKTKQTYTLRAEAPLDQVLEAVATRMNVKLDLDRKALEARGIAPTEIVRVEVKDASAEQLLAAVLEPLGLEGNVVKGRLEVRPRAP